MTIMRSALTAALLTGAMALAAPAYAQLGGAVGGAVGGAGSAAGGAIGGSAGGSMGGGMGGGSIGGSAGAGGNIGANSSGAMGTVDSANGAATNTTTRAVNRASSDADRAQQNATRTLNNTGSANAGVGASASAGGQSASMSGTASSQGMTNSASTTASSTTRRAGRLSGAAAAKENAAEAQTTRALNQQGSASLNANSSATAQEESRRKSHKGRKRRPGAKAPGRFLLSGASVKPTRFSGILNMPIYRAPVEDFRFLVHEFLEVEKYRDLPQFGELSPDLIDDILSNAGKFCEEVLQPLNQPGDAEGCQFENGVVRTPKGFKEAYKAYSEAGWGGLGAPAEYGGADMPELLTMALGEMGMSANQSLAMYPMLTAGAYGALIATGAEWMKKNIVPKMVSGEWAGTMCLTEPGCGTDLRLMKTKAVEQPDGTYRMTGTKIFISGGDQDLTDNIIHMVIAKLPDEKGQIHDDLSTVNFFMVPKVLVGEDGKMGARNRVNTGGIEHKMGIKGQATCVLNFDEAVAWRLGPKPEPVKPGEKRSTSAGMAGMFLIMNAARLGVGVQGIGLGEVAYQNGMAYAHERRVGRALTGPKEPDKPADLEIVHPDVKRMLLQARTCVEGMRALACWTTFNIALAHSKRPEAESAGLLADLMTPVIKSFGTDIGFEAANLAMQCYGGHGYIRDNGVEQFVRDARINQVYEGANGVQAMDLVGRKLGRKGGAAPLALFTALTGWIQENEKDEKLALYVKGVKRATEALQGATLWLAANGLKNPNDAGAGAADYLRLMGITVLAYMWARMAKLSMGKDDALHKDKLMCARYWMEKVVPECPMLLERIQAGSESIMALD